MIQNLNRHTFSAYGKILRDTPASSAFPSSDAWGQSVHHIRAEEVRFWRAVCPVYLDFDLGMTVLAVRRGGGKPVCFYLDKPVCLFEETEFAIVPYQETCSVRLCLPRDATLPQLEPFSAEENLKIGDRLRLGEIYTLFFREEESGFFFKGERHSMYELTYVDHGQLHCVADGSSLLLRQGQLMIFTPDQWHMQYCELNVSARFLTVSFDLESELELKLGNRVFDLSSSDALLLRQILQEIERNDLWSGDFIRGNLKLLLLSLLRETGRQKKYLQTPLALRNENGIVSRTLQYVAAHVYEKLSVEEVSKAIGVSSSHLTTLFRRQMHISPGEYIRRVKLEESKNLIRDGKMNFSQIATVLNYSTIHHFSRQFKSTFGLTPSEYAKSIHGE